MDLHIHDTDFVLHLLSSLGGYYNELASFIACLEAGKMPEAATPQQAMDSLKVVLAEIESARKGRKVSIKPQKTQ